MRPYEIIQGDTKTKIQVYGSNLGQLFVNAAKGMFAAMMAGRLDFNGEPFEQELQVKSVDEETLLVDWLSKLQGIADIDNVAISNIEVTAVADNTITARLQGFYIDRFEQELGEILLDDLEIRETPDGFVTTVTFGE